MGTEVNSEEYFKNLGIQLGTDLEQYLPSYRSGTEEERHQNAVRLVKTFLDMGGPPNAVDYHHWPILTISVVQNCASLVKLLLDRGADVNFKDWNHYGVPCALYAFVMSGGADLNILDMILRAGADLDKRFTRGSAEDWLGSGECFIKDHQTVKILKRIRHERRRRDEIQNAYEFMKVTKPRSENIAASALLHDIVARIAQEHLKITQKEHH